MSSLTDLQNFEDIKVPYPTEGVIRTAQLDDTIAPVNSVQLAVNMNFDRVGAIQTRLGVSSYADSLAEEINNFGTLRNAIIPAGYESLFQVGATSDIVDSHFSAVSAVKVNDTKITVFWMGAAGVGKCQNFSVDETSGTVTAIGTPLTFESTSNDGNKAILMTTNLVLNVWTGPDGDGWARAFNVAGDTVVAGTAYEFDSADGTLMTLAKVDDTHAICFYTGTTSDGIATILAVDSGTFIITEPGSPLTFEAGFAANNSCAALGDGIHFVNFWRNGGGIQVRCFAVNTSTWAITALSTALNWAAVTAFMNAVSVGDGTHIVNIFENSLGKLAAQAFAVNLSTFAVTAVGTPLSTASVGNDLTAVGFGDGFHFAAFYSGNIGDGFAQMIAMDPVTFSMTAVGDPIAGFDFANGGYTASIDLQTNKVMAVWGNVSAVKGQAAMFQSFGAVVNGRWLYAGHTDKVSNTSNGTWTTRRSGLAQVSKPRFSQYLNYVWMVNGNDQIGGDPVATSDGGNFGTDLVPVGFPKGDFIHAGFEGRVWVANKTLGIINYTDIVQFVPPVTYSLTYNPQVNFLSQLSPQTGQSFTALHRVPRALLVFTEDTITRIYGASSVDAYPAYNVGTFSQESIVETKTGIFFHHSSGFYQFDYGSQPVEISRRIIDFVKAIPRANYDDITGVYDGYDSIEWSVGEVVVEGVVFANCVLRYTISTQVWTVYDYVGNVITAMIYYDDGTTINHLMGTHAGRTGAMDTGFTDFGEPFYFEYIDRWRAFTDMYYKTKSISGFNVYHENAAGANLMYQVQKSGPNAWQPLGTIDANANSLMPGASTDDFDVLRLRLAGNTSGAQVVVHGTEITQLTIKGQEVN
jgi:hypothetical protein